MELLDRLEQRIDALLVEVRTLKDENRRLKENNQEELSQLVGENERLRQELEQERSTSEEVVRRLDALLEKLSDNASES